MDGSNLCSCPLCPRTFGKPTSLFTHLRGHHKLTLEESRRLAGMPPKPPVIRGIYLVANPLDGRGYVGKAQDVYLRWSSHLRDLADSRHGNLFLQLAYEKCLCAGTELEFSLVEEVPSESLDDREHYWMEELGTLSSGYNLARSRRRGRTIGYRDEELSAASVELGGLWLGISPDVYSRVGERRFEENTARRRDREAAVVIAAEMGLTPEQVWQVFETQGYLGITYGAWPGKYSYEWRELYWHPLYEHLDLEPGQYFVPPWI